MTGNIGVGKSTLCKRLAETLTDGQFVGEELENPHLADFYDHLSKFPNSPNPHALDLQLYFLNQRYENESRADFVDNLMVLDRCLLEYNEIFVCNLARAGYLSPIDFEKYSSHYQVLSSKLAKPHVVIFLKANIDTALERIRSRDRDYEKTNIDTDYLKGLHNNYIKFLQTIQNHHSDVHLIEVETDELNDDQVFMAVLEKYQLYLDMLENM